MPLNDYQCPYKECKTRYLDIYSTLTNFLDKIFDWCPLHGHQDFEISLSGRVVHDWSQGRYYEHVSPTGETFYSKKEFKDYCKQNGISEVGSYG